MEETISTTDTLQTTETEVIGTVIAPLMREPQPNFDELLARPRIVARITWDMLTTRLFLADVIFDLFANGRAFDNYVFCRGIPCLRFQIVSDVYDAGIAMAGFAPLNDQSRISFTDFDNDIRKSGFHHVLMDLRERNDLIVNGQWSSQKPWRKTQSDANDDTIGTFFLHPLTGVLSATSLATVQVNVFGWLEEAEVSVARAQTNGQRLETGVKMTTGAKAFPEDSFDDLVRIPTLMGKFTWDTTDPLGRLLFNDLMPTDGTNRLSTILSRTRYHNVDVDYHLIVAKTPYHRGVLTLSDQTSGTDESSDRIEWDIADKTCMTIRVNQREKDEVVGDWSRGLTATITSTLKAPEAVSDNVVVLVYTSAPHFTATEWDQTTFSAVQNGVFAKDATNIPQAQCFDLKSTEGVTILGKTRPKQPGGKTLSELVAGEHFSYDLPIVAGSPGAVFPMNNFRNQGGPLATMAMNYAFLEGKIEKRVLVGRTHADFNLNGVIQPFPTKYYGRTRAFVGAEGITDKPTTMDPKSRLNKTMTLRSGDVFTLSAHNNEKYFNFPIKAAAEVAFHVEFNTDGQECPFLYVSEELNGQLYGLLGLP